jgi:hypothetical protein
LVRANARVGGELNMSEATVFYPRQALDFLDRQCALALDAH